VRSEAAAEGAEGTAEAAEAQAAEGPEERTEETAAVAAAPGSPVAADAVAVGDADAAAWVEGGRGHASRAASLTDSSLRQTVASANFWLIFFAVFAGGGGGMVLLNNLSTIVAAQLESPGWG